eukprot:6533350-Alexandrium_andersonii.AAC.1
MTRCAMHCHAMACAAMHSIATTCSAMRSIVIHCLAMQRSTVLLDPRQVMPGITAQFGVAQQTVPSHE